MRMIARQGDSGDGDDVVDRDYSEIHVSQYDIFYHSLNTLCLL